MIGTRRRALHVNQSCRLWCNPYCNRSTQCAYISVDLHGTTIIVVRAVLLRESNESNERPDRSTMHFRISSSLVSAFIALHVACLAGSIVAQGLPLFSSRRNTDGGDPIVRAGFPVPVASLNLDGASTKSPRPDISLGLNEASIDGKLPQFDDSLNLNGSSVVGKLPQPETSLNLNDASITGKLPEPNISVDINGASIDGKLPQLDASLNLNGASITGKLPEPNISVDINGASIDEKLPQLDASLNLNGVSVVGKLPQPETSLNLNDASITGKLPEPNIAIDVSGASIVGKLPQPGGSLDINGSLITGELPEQNSSVDINGTSIDGKLPQLDASLNLNGASITGKLPEPNIAVDVSGASIVGKLLQPGGSLDINESLITGKLLEQNISVDINGAPIVRKLPQLEGSLDLNRASIIENLPRPNISVDLNESSIGGKLSELDASLNLDGALTTGKLPESNISVDLSGVSVSEKIPQPDVPLDVNSESTTETIIPDDSSSKQNGTTSFHNEPIKASYDVQDSVVSTEDAQPEIFSSTTQTTVTQWVQKIPSPKNLKPPADNVTTVEYTGSPMLLGQTIANILYGTPWSSSQTNSKCSNDMKLYNSHKQKSTLWAVKMLDATSKGPEGILDGNIYSFGNFEQCINTKSKNLDISGGYSLVDLDFRPFVHLYPGYYDNNHSKDYDPLDEDASAWEGIKHNVQEDYIQRHKFQWAVCLPDTCESEDVQKIVSNVLIPELNRHGLEANVTIDPMLHTSNKNLYKYTAGFYIVCALYVAVTMLVFAGTLYDLIYLQYRPKSEHGPMKKIMKPFSLISNIERLLKPSESEEFSIINGLKVCAILQVIVGHRWFLEFGNPQMNPDFAHWVIHNFWFGYFKCSIFLETFFVISGFLTFYIITKQLIERKTLNFMPIMIYRWLRIFPVYGTLIVTYIFILPYINDGPYWRKLIYRESERCQTNWWTNVLYINNYVHTDELCVIPSWYLTCDMHFFVVGTLLTYAIWKWRKPGLVLLGTCLALSTVVPAYIIMNEQHRGTPAIDPQSLQDLSKERFYTKVYIKSHMRAMTYFVGILAGYIYMQLKEADYKLSLKSRIFWAPTVLLTGNIIYLSSGLFFRLGHSYVNYEHAIYFIVGRLVWSILISYAIIGHGLSGFGVCISGFLGHRVFQVLGKLVFCIYMFQEISQLQTVNSMKTPTYQSLTMMTWRFCGDVFNALLYGFAINVMIESPFDRLQKNVMRIFVGDAFSKPKTQLSNNDNIKNRSERFTA
uniref:Nose resistant to fluoxetine protein 6 n=1 Tax=Sipha flava TaxID=143950 RepID=A0A2S2R6Q5_9HEMI